jgi:hypothetical protein
MLTADGQGGGGGSSLQLVRVVGNSSISSKLAVVNLGNEGYIIKVQINQ